METLSDENLFSEPSSRPSSELTNLSVDEEILRVLDLVTLSRQDSIDLPPLVNGAQRARTEYYDDEWEEEEEDIQIDLPDNSSHLLEESTNGLLSPCLINSFIG
jgi:hypothetical protein